LKREKNLFVRVIYVKVPKQASGKNDQVTGSIM